jgi:decaprenylphospho-beta-D-ribofuranose 2-oxidase
MLPPLPSQLPRRVFDGFGYSTRSVSGFVEAHSVADVQAAFRYAGEHGLTVGLRGAGRSYGDAAMNGGGIVLDTRSMNRVLAWDPTTGVADVEPGVTIEDLWRRFLKDGWWPAVVPGTMFPTLGGVAAMNVHGKNCFKVGPWGDHILEADLAAPDGNVYRTSRTENEELFNAAIGGFGMLGAFSRLRIKLKRVHSGRVRVRGHYCRNLAEQFDWFEEYTAKSDYCVSWVDCIAGGDALGRGQPHSAVYLAEGEDRSPDFDPARQDLPGHILGVPRALVGTILARFNTNLGMRLLNIGKDLAARFGPKSEVLQAHVAFNFLLDYVPTFRDAYRPHGFVQYQPFVPRESAREVFTNILRLTQARGVPSYLGVLKRHRPDEFLLSHGLDGYSFALDFPVTPDNRAVLWKTLHEASDMVCEAGGRFYPAKDALLRPDHFQRAWGQARISRFNALRAMVDPDRRLRTDLAARFGLCPTSEA